MPGVECVAPAGAVLEGRLRLAPGTPLSRFGRLGGKAAANLVQGLGAETVGDLVRVTPRDIHATGSPVFLSKAIIRRALDPWMDDGSGRDAEPVLVETFDAEFDGTPWRAWSSPGRRPRSLRRSLRSAT